MSHPVPEPSGRPLAPGERLPRGDRETLSSRAEEAIRALMVKYPDPLAATLPALYVAQEDMGFTSLAAMKAVARVLQIPEGHVYGVATFYTMYQKKPVGRFHIQVCTNLCCALRGGAQLFERLCERLKVHPGEVSPDGLWSVEEVECLGSCGSGPCLQVNQETYDEFVDDARLDQIIEACRCGDVPEWGK
ncbi:NADH-quinone oxidoreductase subunit NuoE [Holophaga foetida]|uniref:NADH-quinone oxidoreductase subunit NuoE family protein n=1 Tax=Holophaga foetida TaxID=35839 RepID=UPI000695F3AD|nr:NADH-quinone oxidoreductase subunit NuoE [Holophaga foetida]